MAAIMNAYKTQSKIPLYDENSAQSADAANENIGVKGRDIPLHLLRPSSSPVQDVDESGNIVHRRPSRNDVLREVQSYGDIAKAYNAMNGVEESEGDYEEDYVEGDIPRGGRRAKDLSSVKRFEADYVEDMPNTDEGLLEILELAINNARANLEMMESLYAALAGEN